MQGVTHWMRVVCLTGNCCGERALQACTDKLLILLSYKTKTKTLNPLIIKIRSFSDFCSARLWCGRPSFPSLPDEARTRFFLHGVVGRPVFLLFAPRSDRTPLGAPHGRIPRDNDTFRPRYLYVYFFDPIVHICETSRHFNFKFLFEVKWKDAEGYQTNINKLQKWGPFYNFFNKQLCL